jgi:PTH1 family peptidyl-tRNA hydrolase
MLKLIVFLGNPGTKYKYNRHNAAWMLADVLPFSSTLNWKKKFGALYAFSNDIHFLKPQTYMNRSGESALAAASFYKIVPDEIIVVHDEIELPFGTISLKFSGGLGGHNGLRSMKACFGSADFWRQRLGIGRPDNRPPGKGCSLESSLEAGIADWVLSDFTPAEEEALTPAFSAGAELLAQTFAVEPKELLPEWGKRKCV